MKDLSSFDMLRMLEKGLPKGYCISATEMEREAIMMKAFERIEEEEKEKEEKQ